MKKIDTDSESGLDQTIKELVWVDTVGWDDADLQGQSLINIYYSVCIFLNMYLFIKKTYLCAKLH